MLNDRMAVGFRRALGQLRATPLAVRALLLGALMLAPSLTGDVPLVFAQATRTWVSGVGDDANPCSRTAPCKTFAGAISKTATGGEINVLDPGGFGAVTITKSITISSEGFEAGVLVSGTNGIVINGSPTNAVVVLRGLDIEGLGTGLSGIKMITGGTLYVEKCTVNNFTQLGLDAESPNSEVYVTDSIFRNNPGNTFGGVRVLAASGTIRATLSNVRMENNFDGLQVGNNAKVSVADSVAAGNSNSGFRNFSNTGGTLDITRSTAFNNGNGLDTDSGDANSRIFVASSAITGNTLGLKITSGQILSGLDNILAGNTTDGTFSGSIPLK
jgi:parallel beta helix pectate lyase-like protein